MANRDIDSDDRWLEHVNRYLSQYGLAPIELNSGDMARFYRITAKKTPTVSGGPLVSIIMPAFNAAAYLEYSVASILNQSWENIELILVDDASNDDTWSLIQALAAKDSRIKPLQNSINAGPYICKNRALKIAQGQYVTGHDADDWAHPQRIEKHVKVMIAQPELKASLAYMMRISISGEFTQIDKVGEWSKDGAIKLSMNSCLFEVSTFRQFFGNWDSVRFGADAELYWRLQTTLGGKFAIIDQFAMFLLDAEGSLTNDPVTGINTRIGFSPVRREYRSQYLKWHSALELKNAYIDFPQVPRRFSAPQKMLVDPGTIEKILKE